ncbi:unnamed protein product [marine sediment metagenome]|uniref:Uncharacterized protein n=1 Tax=marine sediment metagenome TaxID=412755 RepID=X0W9M2_9ZZZZ
MGDAADDLREREEQWQLDYSRFYNMHRQGICGGEELCCWCEEILTDEYWEPDA